MSICDEINNCLLNIDIAGNFQRMSISYKIRIAGGSPDERADRMVERPAGRDSGRFDGEISNYLLNIGISGSPLEISISAKIGIAGCLPDERVGRMAGRLVDSGDDRFDNEISKCLLNRGILDSPAEMSISSKIRIPGCLPDGQARCMVDGAADSGSDRFDDEISNYLLKKSAFDRLAECRLAQK